MARFRELLLDVWREACRHIRIDESAAAIAEMLSRQMPLGGLLVRRIDKARSCLETVAVALVDPSRHPEHARTECSSDDLNRVLTWCSRGEMLSGHRREPPQSVLSLVVPQELDSAVLAGPLRDQQGPEGVLLLAAHPGDRFGEDHATLALALLEPFSVALENDRRLREMEVLREAAEADKRSLLTRLGRQALGDTIVGDDVGLRSVMERVELVARSDVPVLIFGETGTGKELIARAIHTRSERSGGPFMRVNCGAIPPELIDSQLFGHERGSFTGATDTHRGWFERADRGTLFLDEIGELPPAAQVRLLRVLQDGSFERVGAQRPITVDVRIVAATHRDLSGMVRDGKFREDLWYRLAVFSVSLPPLRERTGDISALARHFAQRAAVRFGLTPRMPTNEDIGLLVSYSWPGNIRELGAVMDRAAILGDGQNLEVATALGVQNSPLPPRTDNHAPLGPQPAQVGPLDDAIRRHIEAALRATRGRIEGPSGVAALLKVNPHTLRARMRKLGIDWARFRDPPASQHPQ
ncbi:MAG: sigma-54-dependent Fis family transcriptional regulator [Pirellulales bacterium]|nr:sigma-54-dependent Fis family transcriptional regulator [Pirellulales bacterium]